MICSKNEFEDMALDIIQKSVDEAKEEATFFENVPQLAMHKIPEKLLNQFQSEFFELINNPSTAEVDIEHGTVDIGYGRLCYRTAKIWCTINEILAVGESFSEVVPASVLNTTDNLEVF